MSKQHNGSTDPIDHIDGTQQGEDISPYVCFRNGRFESPQYKSIIPTIYPSLHPRAVTIEDAPSLLPKTA